MKKHVFAITALTMAFTVTSKALDYSNVHKYEFNKVTTGSTQSTILASLNSLLQDCDSEIKSNEAKVKSLGYTILEEQSCYFDSNAAAGLSVIGGFSFLK